MKSSILLAAFLITYTIGAGAMSFLNNDKIMNWEWPANRTIKYKIVVEVLDLTPVNKIIKSPSFATDMPDPVSLRGKVIKGRGLLNETETVKLVLPMVEIEEVAKGIKLALGMVDKNTIVCVKTIPATLGDAEENVWLDNLDCK